ncbi:MAG TPA: SRPBCC family protein [Terriglobia bacterium]|nr:SRPBCC family protein [Terriglobia bacterium]
MTRNLKKVLLISGAGVAVFAAVSLLKRQKYSGIKLKKSIIIDRPAADLYSFWRDFQNLPRIADILESVEVLDDHRSRWTIAAPGEIPIQWDAEVTKDIPNEMIGWRSLEDSAIETAGYVRFEDAPGRRGTLIRVALEYNLPAGSVGAIVATLFGKRPGAHVEDMLRRFKQLMETGESSTAEGPRERLAL